MGFASCVREVSAKVDQGAWRQVAKLLDNLPLSPTQREAVRFRAFRRLLNSKPTAATAAKLRKQWPAVAKLLETAAVPAWHRGWRQRVVSQVLDPLADLQFRGGWKRHRLAKLHAAMFDLFSELDTMDFRHPEQRERFAYLKNDSAAFCFGVYHLDPLDPEACQRLYAEGRRCLDHPSFGSLAAA